MRSHRRLLLLSVLLSACQSDRTRSERPWRVSFEPNVSWQVRNDVRIPNDAASTRFALDELGGKGAYAGGRVTLDVDLDGRNALRFVAAPLRTQGTGQFDEPVSFQGKTFSANTDTLGRYRFDTYRMGWSWRMDTRDSLHWRLGTTLLVRDAEIELQQGATSASDDNVGGVPLLHSAAELEIGGAWLLTGDLDAAVAAQGRAIDLSLGIRYQATDAWDLSLGYRLLEGGADNDSVFTFATVQSVIFGVGWSF
ncbi:MAG: hypothetical protein ACI841_000287 [Planctomycetota bacterium]|jgi:hypothetical protein